MGSCTSLCHLEDGPVAWYLPDSNQSFAWQVMQDSFGTARNKSFRQGISRKKHANRKGNEEGQLGGKIRFYTYATAGTDYQYYPCNPTIKLKKGTKMFAKAFFSVPMGRMPIGENNVPQPRTDLKGQGPVLLAPCPRVIAIFVDINGEPQTHEHFCRSSVFQAQVDYEDARLVPDFPDEAIEDSFFTYLCPRAQDDFFFMHFPIIASLSDVQLRTGEYGISMIKAFCELFATLSAGTHELSVKIQMYYDHCDFNCFPKDKNINARGKWFQGFCNTDMKDPHPDPTELYAPDNYIAEGCCKIEIPKDFSKFIAGLLDRKPPKPKYPKSDTDVITKEAKVRAFFIYIYLIYI